MIEQRPSAITRLFDEMVSTSRRTGKFSRRTLRGGARLCVLATTDTILLVIWCQHVKPGEKDVETFRRDCRVPPSASVDRGTQPNDPTWFYVRYRWQDLP